MKRCLNMVFHSLFHSLPSGRLRPQQNMRFTIEQKCSWHALVMGGVPSVGIPHIKIDGYQWWMEISHSMVIHGTPKSSNPMVIKWQKLCKPPYGVSVSPWFTTRSLHSLRSSSHIELLAMSMLLLRGDIRWFTVTVDNDWLVVDLPLWKICESQLGWIFPIYGKS